jgi:hypothetical protein
MLALCVIVTYLLYGSYSHGQAVTSLEVISFPDSTSTFNSCIRSCLSIMPSYIGCARNSCLCQSTNIANHWAYVCAEQNNCAESPNNVPLSLYCQRYSVELVSAAIATAVSSPEAISFADSISTLESCMGSCLSVMPSYIGCGMNSCLCQSTVTANQWAYVCADLNNCAESPNNVPLSLYCQRYSEELAAAATATVAVTTTTPGGLYRVSFSISIANNIKHR